MKRDTSSPVNRVFVKSPVEGVRGVASGRGLEVALFLTLWLGFGVLINSGNLNAFNLQQIGVEAIVERGHFYLEGSHAPELFPRGDVFLRDGHKYAAKQPGQFMAGALVYFFLHLCGLSYVRNYLLTSALVTFLTTSLLTAFAAVAVFRLARGMLAPRASLFWPLASALAYGCATTALAYTGIAHHDAIAAAYLVLAFYLVFRLARGEGAEETKARARLEAACAGLLLGLTLTTSMLPFFMVACVGLYFLSLGRWRLVPFVLAGGVAGLLPLFVYDAASFGNPLLLPNVAGNYTDTFFHAELKNFLSKLGFYARMLALYSPTFALGLAGLVCYPRERRREVIVVWALLLVLLVYITNIDTTGDCQYGARYLLPALPYACLGLSGFGHLPTRAARVAAGVLVVAVALFSFVVNVVGAAVGAMYCPIEQYAFPPYVAALLRGETNAFPLLRWLCLPFAVALALLARSILTQRRITSHN